jgi:hypothetical protein
MPGPFDDDEDLDEKRMEEIFNERVPPGMPPDLAKMMFDIVKESFLGGMPPEEILSELDKLEPTGGSSRGKGKKGGRK